MLLSFDQVIEICASGLIPHLEGPRGEGKTTYGRDLGAHVKRAFRVMNLSAIESTDFCGLPYVAEDGATRYAKPFWMADADVILLDEIDRIRDSAVKSSLLSLLIDKEINGHKLRPDVIILTAGNGKGEKEEYDTIEFDEAMKDRLVTIPFKYTDEQKMKYFKTKYPSNLFVKFLDGKREILKKFSSRRIESFLKASNDLCAFYLDAGTAKAFKHFVESNLVTLQDILTGKYAMETMSSVTRTSAVKEVVNYFYEVNTNDEAKNINKFINSLREEEKTPYFSALRKLCIENPDTFNKKAQMLDKIGMFSGQAQYLRELSK